MSAAVVRTRRRPRTPTDVRMALAFRARGGARGEVAALETAGVTTAICLCYTPNVTSLQSTAKDQAYEKGWWPSGGGAFFDGPYDSGNRSVS